MSTLRRFVLFEYFILKHIRVWSIYIGIFFLFWLGQLLKFGQNIGSIAICQMMKRQMHDCPNFWQIAQKKNCQTTLASGPGVARCSLRLQTFARPSLRYCLSLHDVKTTLKHCFNVIRLSMFRDSTHFFGGDLSKIPFGQFFGILQFDTMHVTQNINYKID